MGELIRVLVLGGTGLVGHMVVRRLSLSKDISVTWTNHTNQQDPNYLDVVAHPERLVQIFEERSPEYVVNCIGLTTAHIKEDTYPSIHSAIMTNALFPRYLSEVASSQTIKVIHISTDGVFSGMSGPYFEDSFQDGMDVYGRTKSLGEVNHHSFLNVRCSIVGPDPRKHQGLLEWFLSHPDFSYVYGFEDYQWNGVTSLDFAELCLKIILSGCFDGVVNESSIHHFCPNEPVTKYQLLRIFASAFKRNIEIRPSKAPHGPVNRVLKTKFSSLKTICEKDRPMTLAVASLADFMSN